MKAHRIFSILITSFLFIVFSVPLTSFAKVGELKKRDPYKREACRYCHKGPQKSQIDDTKGPWCVPCHRQHKVETTLGLQTFFEQTQKLNHKGIAPQKEALILQEMIEIPSGSFLMGQNNTKKSLGPRHTVALEPYFIDQYHVSNFYYQTFVSETGRTPPPHWRGGRFPANKGNHPVSFVSWYDARDYCEWVGKRLPSEAEWEKAARGTDGRMYPWGPKHLKRHANVYMEGLGGTTTINHFPEGLSPYGLYDMAGNLFQWTTAWFKPYPGNAIPHPNFGEQLKVLRGGSFYDCSNYRCGISFQTFNRIALLPQTRAISAGFRCARSVSQSLKP